MTNYLTNVKVVQYVKPTNTNIEIPHKIQEHKPHALYNGVCFVVWAFGIYICCCAFRKLAETKV